MKVSDYIIKYLETMGVKYIYGYIGGAVTHLIDSIYKNESVNFVQCYHEQCAAFEASAAAKLSGKLSVAIATSGPGATNLITGIADAYFDSAPTLFITGQVNTYDFKYQRNIRQKGFQETDIVSIVKPITKYSVLIDSVDKVEIELKKAVQIAMSGRPGPVLIDLPMDIQRQDIQINEQSFLTSDQAVNYPESINDNELELIYDMLTNAKLPLIIVGGGVSRSQSQKEVIKLSEKLLIPVVITLLGKDTFPHYHKLFGGFIGAYGNRYGNILLSKADTILVLGARLDTRQIGNNIEHLKNKKFIWVDIDGNEISESRVKASVSIVCDLKRFLERFLAFIEKIKSTDLYKRDEFIGNLYHLKELFNPLSELRRADRNNWHYQVMQLISEKSSEEDVFCVDVGQNQMLAAQVVMIKGHQRFITSGGMGAMGYALPAGIAVSMESGKRSIVIVGDGGLQINLQELNTVSYYKLPIIIFVFNNKSLGMIKQFQDMYFDKRYYATEEKFGYRSCNFIDIAKAYNINTRTIDKFSDLNKELDFIFRDAELPLLVQIEIDYKTDIFPKLEFSKPIYDIDPSISEDEKEFINKLFI